MALINRPPMGLNAGRARGPFSSRMKANRWAAVNNITSGHLAHLGVVNRNPVLTAAGFSRPGWYVQSPQISASGTGPSGSGGGSSSGGPGTAGSPPPAAGHQPQITMGAESVEPEIVDNNVRLTDRGRKFRGIDTFTPDEMLTPEKSPRFLNWNAIERHGSWCGRKGTGRIIDDGTTCVDSGASSIDSAYKGLCIVPLELNDQNDDNAQHTCAMLLGFTDQYPGYSGGDVNLCVVEPEPAWGHELDLRGFPGPDITLSKSASLTLRVNADYQTVRFASKTGIPLQTIKGITVAWSAGGFPRDVDKRDDSTVVGSKSITLDQDRATWDGTSTNYDITVPATGVYYVTVWAHSLTGTSEPVYGRFEIT